MESTPGSVALEVYHRFIEWVATGVDLPVVVIVAGSILAFPKGTIRWWPWKCPTPSAGGSGAIVP